MTSCPHPRLLGPSSSLTHTEGHHIPALARTFCHRHTRSTGLPSCASGSARWQYSASVPATLTDHLHLLFRNGTVDTSSMYGWSTGGCMEVCCVLTDWMRAWGHFNSILWRKGSKQCTARAKTWLCYKEFRGIIGWWTGRSQQERDKTRCSVRSRRQDRTG